MSRLLLVDDNPSIHKIAETLLGSSSIELVCVGSAQEALMMLDSGERFDVALIDTAMPGMDGWELLSRMRKHPDSAFIPIAMMAGVLDTVDPEKLRYAPIQGFLKKPIELRELADRVQQLLATPVTLSEHDSASDSQAVLSPFSTVPGAKFKSLPEFRDATEGHLPKDLANDDLLLLTPEDFWAEAEPALVHGATGSTAPAGAQEPPDHPVTLDLEELDLDSLRDLHEDDLPTQPEVPLAHMPEEHPESAPTAHDIPLPDFLDTPDSLAEEETLALPGLAIRAHELPDLGEVPDFEAFEGMPTRHEAALPHEALPQDPSPWESPAALALPTVVAGTAIAGAVAPHPVQPDLDAPEPEPLSPESQAELVHPVPTIETLRPEPIATGAATGSDPEAVVQAILANPVLMDALAKALVAKLGDQALREIAWELMPELAEKLPR